MTKTLPASGIIQCDRCFKNCGGTPKFDQTRRTEGAWRITANPLAWGNVTPEIVVLGFSKGPTQAGAIASTPHDEIAYKEGRHFVGKILAHIGLLEANDSIPFKQIASAAIANTNGRFHFGSLIRCTVERLDPKTFEWKGTGGGMLDKFVGSPFGQEVAGNCVDQYLAKLPDTTKLIVMFGLGRQLNYVHESFRLYERVRKGTWKWINKVAYTDGKVVVVHVEHFASLGPHIPNWMGENGHSRGLYGQQAKEAVAFAIGK